MFNYASMLAKENLFQKALEQDLKIKVDEEGAITLEWENLKHEVDVLGISTAEALEVGRYVYYYDTIERLLERPRIQKDYGSLVALYFLEQFIDQNIEREKLYKGQVLFNYLGNRAGKITVEESWASHDREKLTLCQCLVAGYKFKEVMGSHFLVSLPQHNEQVVTNSHCDCSEFKNYKRCNHWLGVQTLIKHRWACQKVIGQNDT